jgi:hypothetical protein
MDWKYMPLYPTQNDPRRFSGQVTVPVALKGSLVRDGEYPVKIACLTKGCEGVPEAATTFRVTGAPTALAWTDLAAANVLPLPPLSGGEQDPSRPHRRVTCKSGSSLPANLQDPPRLMVTADDGATWRTISLADVALGSQADTAGCRAVSLDPNAVDTFYVAGGGRRGAYDWDRDPAPLHTIDGGTSWRRIPAPEGYGQPGQFIGFTVTSNRVTSWFGKTESEQSRAPAMITGSATSDGGKTWTTVPLACPASAPCAWDVPSSLYLHGYRGLLRSNDRGQTWNWASWAGQRLSTPGRGYHRLTDDTLEVAGACTGGEFDQLCAPLLRSSDGGQTWRWVEVPAPPGGWSHEPDVRLQTDGSLLVRSGERFPAPSDGWYQLRRGSATWEPVKAPAQSGG